MSESKSVFDADACKRTQHDQWNEDAAARHGNWSMGIGVTWELGSDHGERLAISYVGQK